MKLLGPEDGCKQVDVGGRRYDRQRDGTFHVPDDAAKALRASGDFTPARTSLRGVQGYRCPACGHLAVFPRNCGRCGHEELQPE